MLKKWALAVLVLYIVLLTVASLLNISATPKIGFDFDDKIYHALAYLLFTLLWFNYLRTTQLKHKYLVLILVPVVYGIIIEALQFVMSNSRTADFYDALANTLGVVFAVGIIHFTKNLTLK